MKNPKVIQIRDNWNYTIPTFKVEDGSIQDGAGTEIKLCRGDAADSAKPRQEGVFTETLLQVCRTYLEAVNVPPLASRETSSAITKIDEALMWLQKRQDDRKLREVQGTYKP